LSDVLATSSAQSNKGEQLQAYATCSKIQVSALPRPTLSTTKLGHVERKKFCPMELLRMHHQHPRALQLQIAERTGKKTCIDSEKNIYEIGIE
jgi:hypothetical protein